MCIMKCHKFKKKKNIYKIQCGRKADEFEKINVRRISEQAEKMKKDDFVGEKENVCPRHRKRLTMQTVRASTQGSRCVCVFVCVKEGQEEKTRLSRRIIMLRRKLKKKKYKKKQQKQTQKKEGNDRNKMIAGCFEKLRIQENENRELKTSGQNDIGEGRYT